MARTWWCADRTRRRIRRARSFGIIGTRPTRPAGCPSSSSARHAGDVGIVPRRQPRMCGIAGLWAPRMAPEQRTALTRRMIDRLRHRGPDGTALWDGLGITLAIARLAIVDPGTPARVLRSESGQVRAVVNGEVY